MAVLHLEFQIDSEVYPELHATLSSISGEASRGERLRQLAASGLVWEYVRLRTPATPVQRAPAADKPVPGARAAPVAAAAPPKARPASAPRAEPADFVDLAIDAPAPPAPRAAAVRSTEPPLLVDVVPEPSPPAPVEAVRDDTAVAGEASAADEHAASRARLLRMRDRGLFRNG